MIKVDGIVYKIGVASLQRQADFHDLNSTQMENGDLRTERDGVYYNYSLTLEPAFLPKDEYQNFYSVITAPVSSHEVTIFLGKNDEYSFKARFDGINDELVFLSPTTAFWKQLTINFTSVKLARKR